MTYFAVSIVSSDPLTPLSTTSLGENPNTFKYLQTIIEHFMDPAAYFTVYNFTNKTIPKLTRRHCSGRVVSPETYRQVKSLYGHCKQTVVRGDL